MTKFLASAKRGVWLVVGIVVFVLVVNAVNWGLSEFRPKVAFLPTVFRLLLIPVSWVYLMWIMAKGRKLNNLRATILFWLGVFVASALFMLLKGGGGWIFPGLLIVPLLAMGYEAYVAPFLLLWICLVGKVVAGKTEREAFWIANLSLLGIQAGVPLLAGLIGWHGHGGM